jgi:hypothetical protein
MNAKDQMTATDRDTCYGLAREENIRIFGLMSARVVNKAPYLLDLLGSSDGTLCWSGFAPMDCRKW